jgi:hypothetical protein
MCWNLEIWACAAAARVETNSRVRKVSLTMVLLLEKQLVDHEVGRFPSVSALQTREDRPCH